MLKVAEFLNNHPEVTYLNLCYNRICDRGLKILSEEYFAHDNDLQHLDLFGCDVTWQGVQYLCEQSQYFKLQSLRVGANPLGTLGGIACSELLGLSKLKYLDVGNSNQTLHSIAYLNYALLGELGINHTLEVLNYSNIIPESQYYVTDTGQLAEQLTQTLQVNTTLIELHLQKNGLDGHDIELLVFGLKRNRTLQLLDLGFNLIADHGVEYLCSWLKTRPQLIALNLAGNRITNAGARVLAPTLCFSKVRLLDLSRNVIRDAGLVTLLSHIKKPQMMRMLFMWGNFFHQRSLEKLDKLVRTNILEQQNIDIQVYEVDERLYAAYYPANRYNHRYFNVLDYGYPPFLLVKKVKVIKEKDASPRFLLNYHDYELYPRFKGLVRPSEPCEDYVAKTSDELLEACVDYERRELLKVDRDESCAASCSCSITFEKQCSSTCSCSF